MSLAYIEASLDEFLKHETKRVLVLKGDWGTGKTFFWSKKYVPSRLKEKIKRPYAYVSLFGANSIVDITKRVFYGPIVGQKDMRTRVVESLKVGGTHTIKGLTKAIPIIKDMDISVANIEGLLIRGYLICFDDLERTGTDLRMEDFMGLVAQLKEQQNCQIVLILNESELLEKDKKAFDKYREKVVDIEIEYVPEIGDNIRLVCTEDKLYKIFKSIFEELGIRSIRIAQQAAWNCEAFRSLLEAAETQVADRILRDIAVLTCFHCKPDLKVDLVRLKEMYSPTSPSKIMEEDREIWRILNGLRFEYDAIHELIIGQISSNDFDVDRFKQELVRLGSEQDKREIEIECSDIWDRVYSNGFTTGESDLIDAFSKFLDDHAGDISRKRLIEMIALLKDLNAGDREQGWIDSNILGHMNEFTLQEVMDAHNWTPNSEIREKLSQRQNLIKKDRTIESVVKRISENKSLSPGHILFLSAQDEDAWYEWFKTYTSPEFFPNLRTFHTIFNSSSPEDDQRRIGEVMQAALRRIAQDDPLNAIKITSNLRLKLDLPSGSDTAPGRDSS